MNYRRDIDGLRAIAILAVVGYHGFPASVPGGFIGVDIFFVISGFLISTIIFRQLGNGTFSLRNFYSRRIRRIFPALILLTIVTWLAGWYLLFPDEFRQLGKHIAAGNGFVSNLILWSEAGYFDVASEAKPLLHLWSLGIEEQFYILWPVSLVLVWKRKFNLLAVTLFVAFASFAANIHALHSHTSAASFYLPQNRFWELMIGGVLSYLTLHRGDWQPRKKWLVNSLSVVGFTSLGLAGAFLDKSSAFPGWSALPPTLGTFLLIATPASWLNRYVLGNRVLVYIGLISYPLYLWHWTVLYFFRILEYSSRGLMAIGVLLSFVLAAATYEFAEKAVKRNKSNSLVYVLFSLSLLLIGLGLSTRQGVFSPRNNSDIVKLAMDAVGDSESLMGMRRSEIDGVEVFVKEGAAEKVLFIGDSHMNQYSPRIVKILDEDPLNHKTAVFATHAGCPPYPGVYEDGHPRCSQEFRETVFAYALSPEVDAVVLGNWVGYMLQVEKPKLGENEFYYLLDGEKIHFFEGGIELARRAFEDFVMSVAKLKKVYLIIDNPSGPMFDPKAHFSGSRISGTVGSLVRFHEYDEKHAEERRWLLDLASRANAIVIDTVELLCEDGQCLAAMPDGRPIYRDKDHLRPFYVKEYMDILDVTVKK